MLENSKLQLKSFCLFRHKIYPFILIIPNATGHFLLLSQQKMHNYTWWFQYLMQQVQLTAKQLVISNFGVLRTNFNLQAKPRNCKNKKKHKDLSVKRRIFKLQCMQVKRYIMLENSKL